MNKKPRCWNRNNWVSSNNEYKKKWRKQHYKKNPWIKTWNYIRTRLLLCPRYNGKKRKINCTITAKDLKRMWFRDKAYLMKKPSIDRINNNGHYTPQNCRYMECSENTKRSMGLIYTLCQGKQEKIMIGRMENLRKRVKGNSRLVYGDLDAGLYTKKEVFAETIRIMKSMKPKAITERKNGK